jgi:hypothetical protein
MEFRILTDDLESIVRLGMFLDLTFKKMDRIGDKHYMQLDLNRINEIHIKGRSMNREPCKG